MRQTKSKSSLKVGDLARLKSEGVDSGALPVRLKGEIVLIFEVLPNDMVRVTNGVTRLLAYKYEMEAVDEGGRSSHG